MPKNNDLSVLATVLEQPELEKSALFGPKTEKTTLDSSNYFLFMLGTDTVYTHLPMKNSSTPLKPTAYDNGETLSYMARVIADRLGEEAEINAEQPLSFSTPSVDVVNGPTTLGTEVGERISQGVFLILKALAEGKTNIQISAHSRGAVESILIAHELERIKLALKADSNQTIFSILSNSPCTYTKAAVQKYFKEVNETAEVRAALAERLSVAKLHMFLMDPVPGGSYMGVSWLAWRDERFYIKPPCTTAELFLFRDERTRCFKPIVPSGINPVLTPGHHGSASGNLYSQTLQPVPIDIEHKDTSSVQHLMIAKLLAFINKSTHLFDGEQQPIDVQHPDLDKTTNNYLNKNPKERAKQVLELYKTVHLNDKGFRHFGDKTSYLALGREKSGSGARMVHYGAHNSTGLDAIIAGLDGEFVNADHALLHLHDQMSFSLEGDEDEGESLIAKFSNVLSSLFTGYISSSDSKIKALLEKESDRRVTFQALAIFIDTISKKYLRNHLTLDVKTKLLSELDETFSVLNGFKKSGEDALINTIISECENILRSGIKNTADTHYRSLKDQTNKINRQLGYYLISNQGFELVFNNFLNLIDQKALVDNDVSAALKKVRVQLALINPITIKSVRDAFNGQILNLKEATGGAEAIAILKELVTNRTTGLDPYFAADLIDEADFLTQLNILHENIDSLINGKAHIQLLAGNLSLELDVQKLNRYKDRVVKLSSEILVKKNIDLHKKPLSISDEFFAKVKPLAIALGADNPELIDLQKEFSSLNQDLAHLKLQKAQADESLADALVKYNADKMELEENLKQKMQLASDARLEDKVKYEKAIQELQEKLVSFETKSKESIIDLEKQLSNKTQQYTEELLQQKREAELVLKEEISKMELQKEELKQQLRKQRELTSIAHEQEKGQYEITITELKERLVSLERSHSQRIELLQKKATTKAEQYTQELEKQTKAAELVLKLTTEKLALEKETLKQELSQQLLLVTKASGNDKEQYEKAVAELSARLLSMAKEHSESIDLLHKDAVIKAEQYAQELEKQTRAAEQVLKLTTEKFSMEKETLQQELGQKLLLATKASEQDKEAIAELNVRLLSMTRAHSESIDILHKDAATKAEQYAQELEKQARDAELVLKLTTEKLNLERDVIKQELELATTNHAEGKGQNEKVIAELKERMTSVASSNAQYLDLLKNEAIAKAEQYTLELKKQAGAAEQVLKLTTEKLSMEKEALKQELSQKLLLATTASAQDKQQYEKEIAELNASLLSYSEKIERLEFDITKREKHYTRELEKNEETITSLKERLISMEKNKTSDELNADEKIKQLNAEKVNQEKLIEQLLSSKELTCANFINTKLMPLTQGYLKHLCKQAKNINSSFDSNDLSAFSGYDSDKERYAKIIEKYSATERLLSSLTDKKTNPLPSCRIVQFTKSLKTINEQLKKHRDTEWTNYFRASMLAIGVVCSGIIPGIIALLAYSSYKGKSPLFFTKSEGEQYVDNIKHSIFSMFKAKSASFNTGKDIDSDKIDEFLNDFDAAPGA